MPQMGFASSINQEKVEYGAIDVKSLLVLTFQLGLVLFALHLFRIEALNGLVEIAPLIFGGFLLHAILPFSFRQPFFLLLSVAALVIVLSLVNSLWVLGIGLLLIGLCHLPLGLGLRVALIVAVVALLAAFRAEWISGSSRELPAVVLPTLGTMFMFRLAVYLYDIRHEKTPATLWERLSYFFLLPNVCFPLFPVIDYQAFRRTYYDKPAQGIYQKGVLWIFRGVLHLIAYRVVYFYFVLSPSEVTDLAGVVQYMVSTYALYLRISGLFHLVIGILCLFGFNLPETHHLYYLASSFNDYWRRINIYWKDFMMKLFYYPTFMRARKLGMTTGLVISTLVVFAGTWVLHSYQWFWLQGSFPLTWPDALFWGILGLLVVGNSVWEAKRGRKRVLKKAAWSWLNASIYAAKVVGMFVFITVLWTLWSSATVGEFWSLLLVAASSNVVDWLILIAGLAFFVGVGVMVQYLNSRGVKVSLAGSSPSFGRSVVVTSLGALLLIILAMPQAQGRMEENVSSVLVSIQSDQMNKRDQDRQERGYYEGLLVKARFTSQFQTEEKAPEDWGDIVRSGAALMTGDLYRQVLIPSKSTPYKGATVKTNQWGMRDIEYSKEKAPGTYRIALLGASYIMGAGVENEEIFEKGVEDRLNLDRGGEAYSHYEILNFAVGGTGLLQQVLANDEKVMAFSPNSVFYITHQREIERTIKRLIQPFKEGAHIQYEYLQSILRESGVQPEMESTEIERRLLPYGAEMVQWGYTMIAEESRRNNAIPVWIYMPLTKLATDPQELAQLVEMAKNAGFIILNLDGVFDGYDIKELRVAPWDLHPNKLGHQLIADRLYEEMVKNEHLLGLGWDAEPEMDNAEISSK